MATRTVTATATQQDRLLSVVEARKRLGIGHTSIYALLKTGELKSAQIGSRRLVPESVVAAFIASRIK